MVLSKARAPTDAVPTRMCVHYCSGDKNGTRLILCVTHHHCMLIYTIAAFTMLYVEKTWVQRNKFTSVILVCCNMYNHYHQGPFDLVEANAGNEDDDNLKTGPSF